MRRGTWLDQRTGLLECTGVDAAATACLVRDPKNGGHVERKNGGYGGWRVDRACAGVAVVVGEKVVVFCEGAVTSREM